MPRSQFRFLFLDLVEVYADMYAMLIGVYAVVPIVIAAVGSCAIGHIVLLLALASPPFIASYIVKRLRLSNEKRLFDKITDLIMNILVEVAIPIAVGGVVAGIVVAQKFSNMKGLSNVAYIYFVAETFTLWIIVFVKILAKILGQVLQRFLVRLRPKTTTPLWMKLLRFAIEVFIITTLIYILLIYYSLWTVVCKY